MKDGNQRATIDLGQPRYILKLIAEVARAGEVLRLPLYTYITVY